jgi:hypothetical protein
MSAADATTVAALTWAQALTAAMVVAGTALLAGIVVILGRRWAPQRDAGASVVRSWIAITLVIGLVLFCAFALALNDANLRSTLVGGLTASVGAAIAFYFSAKSSDQARQDILDATVGTETVPDLKGSTEPEAAALLGRTSLRLKIDPAGSAAATAVVAQQDPVRDTQVQKGHAVVVTLR